MPHSLVADRSFVDVGFVTYCLLSNYLSQSSVAYIFQSKLNIMCLADLATTAKIVSLEWYKGEHGYLEPDCPCLAVCFDNGRCQIMKHEADDGMYISSEGELINYKKED